MARMCLGSDLPGGKDGHVYLLRTSRGSMRNDRGMRSGM